MRPVLLPLAVLAATLAAAPATGSGGTQSVRCEAGVAFAAEARVDGRPLVIRNAALLEFLGIDVYSAAVYLPPEADGSPDVLDASPKKLEIAYHRDLSAEQIVRATRKAVRRNPDLADGRLDDAFQKLYDCTTDVREDDRYRAYHADGAVRLELNGRTTCILEGDDFARAFFGIWLSDHALSSSLRDRLLAGG